MREKHLFGNRIHCRRPPLRPHRRRLPHRTGPLPPQALRQRIPHRQRPPVLLLTIHSRQRPHITFFHPSTLHLPSTISPTDHASLPPTMHLYNQSCLSNLPNPSPSSPSD